MIPALALIITAYVVFRCAELSIGRLEKALCSVFNERWYKLVYLIAFFIIFFAAIITGIIAIDQIIAIMKVAKESSPTF